jgi:phage RecT family recombinase
MATAQQSRTANGPPQTIEQARSLLDRILDGMPDRVNVKTRLIGEALTKRIASIELVLPPQMKGQGERLARRALITFNRTPDLADCPEDVFVRCVIQAAELGLAIDGKLCYVVRYKQQFQVQADYKGLVAVAKRSGQILDCKADVVYEADEFLYEHENGRDGLRHVPDFGTPDRGKVIAAFASLLLPGGIFRCCVVSRADLDKIKRAAPAKGGPWSSWEDEMQKKSAVRRALKFYCDDPGMVAALELDEHEDETGESAKPEPLPAGRIDLRRPAAPAPQAETWKPIKVAGDPPAVAESTPAEGDRAADLAELDAHEAAEHGHAAGKGDAAE